MATTSLPSVRVSGATFATSLSDASTAAARLWTGLVLLLVGLLPAPRRAGRHVAPRLPRPVVRVERGTAAAGGTDVLGVGHERSPGLGGALRRVFPDRRSLWLPIVLVLEFLTGVLIGVLT